MSVEQLELGVSTERLMAIASGDLPTGVAEIDALGGYASEFTPRWSAMSRHQGQPPIYGNGERSVSFVEYSQMVERGNRGYWSQDDQAQAALSAITRGEVPVGYEELFDGTDAVEGAHDTIRLEAFHLLSLSQEIAMVEHTEQETARSAQQAAQLATREATLQATSTEDAEIAALQVTEAQNPAPVGRVQSPEVRSHRHNHQRREGFGRRIARFFGDRIDWLGAQFA